MTQIAFVDRYQVLDIPYPDLETTCLGECEGTGLIPIAKDDEESIYHELWLESEKENPSLDGYHFVKCPDCDGTGQRP